MSSGLRVGRGSCRYPFLTNKALPALSTILCKHSTKRGERRKYCNPGARKSLTMKLVDNWTSSIPFESNSCVPGTVLTSKGSLKLGSIEVTGVSLTPLGNSIDRGSGGSICLSTLLMPGYPTAAYTKKHRKAAQVSSPNVEYWLAILMSDHL